MRIIIEINEPIELSEASILLTDLQDFSNQKIRLGLIKKMMIETNEPRTTKKNI